MLYIFKFSFLSIRIFVETSNVKTNILSFWNSWKSLVNLFLDCCMEFSQMLFLKYKELTLMISIFFLNGPFFFWSCDNAINFVLYIIDFVFKFNLFIFKLFDCLKEIWLSMFSLQLLSHSECNGALVECLISSDGHW